MIDTTRLTDKVQHQLEGRLHRWVLGDEAGHVVLESFRCGAPPQRLDVNPGVSVPQVRDQVAVLV